MYFHQSRNVEQANLPFRPTVAQYRAYLAHYGVTVPSRLRKDDLDAVALQVMYGTVEETVRQIEAVGGRIADVVVTCGNCGAVAVPGYDYCDSCLRSMAAADDAWRAHMNPPDVEVVPVERVAVTALQLCRTYRFDQPDGFHGGGRVTVTNVERADGVVYVTGYWHHDTGNAPIDTGDGMFTLDDTVVDVTDSDPVVVAVLDAVEGQTFTGTWTAETGTGETFETAPCGSPSEVLDVVLTFLENYDMPGPDHTGVRVLSSAPGCRYFAMCDRPAAGTTSHPVLGAVPTCQRCADRFDLDVRPF